MRALWLVDALTDAGLQVVPHIGWQTRGWEPWAPQYGIVHATAAPATQADEDQVRIVRDGHSTLAGPIANCCVDRTGRWHVLASGRCNTALTGWAGPAQGLGNTNLLGVEANNDNRAEPWPAVQYEAYARGWAAICTRLGWPARKLVGHKEHQPGDKSDPTFAMDAFRHRVTQLLEGDDMWTESLNRDGSGPQITALADDTMPDNWSRVAAGLLGYAAMAASPAGRSRAAADVWQRENPTAGASYGTLVRQVHDGSAPGQLRDRELLEAVLAAVTGGDALAVLARIDQHHLEVSIRLAEMDTAREVAERAAAAERAELAELVRQATSGERDAAAVVDEIARRLAPVPG
jgi:hypothetical protein